MDPGETLIMEHSRTQAGRVAAWVGSDARRFAKILDMLTGPDRELARRAAWALGLAAEAQPRLVTEKPISRMLEHARHPGIHPAEARAIFRILQNANIPANLEGRAWETAMAALGGPAAVAVKAFALTVLRRLGAGQPALLAEVRALVAEQLPGASPAFRARARREFGMRGPL